MIQYKTHSLSFDFSLFSSRFGFVDFTPAPLNIDKLGGRSYWGAAADEEDDEAAAVVDDAGADVGTAATAAPTSTSSPVASGDDAVNCKSVLTPPAAPVALASIVPAPVAPALVFPAPVAPAAFLEVAENGIVDAACGLPPPLEDFDVDFDADFNEEAGGILPANLASAVARMDFCVYNAEYERAAAVAAAAEDDDDDEAEAEDDFAGCMSRMSIRLTLGAKGSWLTGAFSRRPTIFTCTGFDLLPVTLVVVVVVMM